MQSTFTSWGECLIKNENAPRFDGATEKLIKLIQKNEDLDTSAIVILLNKVGNITTIGLAAVREDQTVCLLGLEDNAIPA